jgi:hypothetical protein
VCGLSGKEFLPWGRGEWPKKVLLPEVTGIPLQPSRESSLGTVLSPRGLLHPVPLPPHPGPPAGRMGPFRPCRVYLLIHSFS